MSLGIDEVDLAPEIRMGDVDIVVGKGRAVIEAMSCGVRPTCTTASVARAGSPRTPIPWPRPTASAAKGATAGSTPTDWPPTSPTTPPSGDAWAVSSCCGTTTRATTRHALLEVPAGLGAGQGRTPTLESEIGRQIELRWAAESALFGLRAEMRRSSARAEADETRLGHHLELARQEAHRAGKELAAAMVELEKVRTRVEEYRQRNRRLRRRLRRLGVEVGGRVDD